MKTYEPNDYSYRYEFDSWQEFLDYLQDDSLKVSAAEPSSGYGCQSTHHDSWYGTDSFDHALKLATDGWDDGVKQIQSMSAKLVDKVSSKLEREELVNDVSGAGFDVGLVLEGIPEHWARFETTVVDGCGKILRIRMNTTVSGGIGTDVIFARGAALAALVEVLEMAGIRCEVYADPFDGGTKSQTNISASVLFKSAEQPLDIARLAFAFAHPSMLRRFGFRLVETVPQKFARKQGWYGMPTESDVSKSQSDIYVSSATLGAAQWTNPESAQAWIIEQLKKQGVEIDD